MIYGLPEIISKVAEYVLGFSKHKAYDVSRGT
jgi:hypothetical protein